jgi:hypothetical protein
MNPALKLPNQSNPINLPKIVRYISCTLLAALVGLAFVYIKNQQFVLGEQIRQTERNIRDVRCENDVLLARVSELSSRRALQQRIADGFINVVRISGDKIARLTPPVPATEVGVLRTAFNERKAQ